MLLLQPPGVYAPQRDTELLADAFRDEPLPPGAHVLDIGTGTGYSRCWRPAPAERGTPCPAVSGRNIGGCG